MGALEPFSHRVHQRRDAKLLNQSSAWLEDDWRYTSSLPSALMACTGSLLPSPLTFSSMFKYVFRYEFHLAVFSPIIHFFVFVSSNCCFATLFLELFSKCVRTCEVWEV